MSGRQEKSYTLLLAQDVREELKRVGLRSTMTRYGDSFVGLDDRPAAARIRKADLFVSLHFNSALHHTLSNPHPEEAKLLVIDNISKVLPDAVYIHSAACDHLT